MPIYDYRCKGCNFIYDIFHKGKELPEDIRCPHCGSHQYIKLISLPGIIMKETTPASCNQGVCGAEGIRSCQHCPIDETGS